MKTRQSVMLKIKEERVIQSLPPVKTEEATRDNAFSINGISQPISIKHEDSTDEKHSAAEPFQKNKSKQICSLHFVILTLFYNRCLRTL